MTSCQACWESGWFEPRARFCNLAEPSLKIKIGHKLKKFTKKCKNIDHNIPYLILVNPKKRPLTSWGKKSIKLKNPSSAKFVKLAEEFEAEVEVSHNGQAVSGRSIMGLMMLAASPGCSISISANGEDADKALDALVGLVAEGFYED